MNQFLLNNLDATLREKWDIWHQNLHKFWQKFVFWTLCTEYFRFDGRYDNDYPKCKRLWKKLKGSSSFEKFPCLEKVNSAFPRNFFEIFQNSQKSSESHKNWNKCIYEVKFSKLLHKTSHQCCYVVNTALWYASININTIIL